MKYQSKFKQFVLKKGLNVSSAKWRTFCLGLNVLKTRHDTLHDISPNKNSIIIWNQERQPIYRPHGWAVGFISWHHGDVIKWKYFPRYWPFVRGIHRSPVNSPHKGQWLGALMFSLICAWTNDWVNNRDAGDLRLHRAHYVATVVSSEKSALEISGVNCKCYWHLPSLLTHYVLIKALSVSKGLPTMC